MSAIFLLLKAMPSWMKVGLAMAAVVGVLQLQHWWTVRGLNNAIKDVRFELASEKASNANLRIGVSEQNRAIERTTSTIKIIQAEAAKEAIQVTLEGERTSEALREEKSNPVEPGYEAMNEWLASQFEETK